jgi:hypothetical protein
MSPDAAKQFFFFAGFVLLAAAGIERQAVAASGASCSGARRYAAGTTRTIFALPDRKRLVLPKHPDRRRV